MKRMQIIIISGFLILCNSCQKKNAEEFLSENRSIRFEKIQFYKKPPSDTNRTAFQSRLTYYFDEGIPHRWLLLDSVGKRKTDYIYEYDRSGIQVGARYIEDYDSIYAPEKVRFENDSTQITEWIDSTGAVYYTMIDNLDRAGKTIRATFIGDTTHGYDSTFYSSEGFEKRIFFTSVKGKVYNDRSFEYDEIDEMGNWTKRRKIMNDTVVDYQEREIHYDPFFTSNNGIYYEGVISSGEWDENVFSFTNDESILFFTRTRNWQDQKGLLSQKYNGLLTNADTLVELDSIYNGAISPSGERIIYSKKNDSTESVWLAQLVHGTFRSGINLSETSGVEGGYFNWLDENELYFYVPRNNGDIVQGVLKDNQLSITNSLSILNTAKSTEFSPFMDPNKRFIIFTRYLEGDPSEQGFFVSYNKGDELKPIWTKPEKIKALPYGWNAYVTKDYSRFLYTDGSMIKSIPFKSIGLDLNVK